MVLARDCEGNHSSTMFAVNDQMALWGGLPGGSSFFRPHSLCGAKRLFWTATLSSRLRASSLQT